MKYIYTGELEDSCVDEEGNVIALIPDQVVELTRVPNEFAKHLIEFKEVAKVAPVGEVPVKEEKALKAKKPKKGFY